MFKFAATFYITILQREKNRNLIPDMIKYLKAYINYSPECARWLLSEFVNLDLIKENLLTNSVIFMLNLIGGLLYAALLKVYEVERHDLNNYWDDFENSKGSNCRQTVCGNFILSLLYLLPELKKYSAHQNTFLQLIARFTTLGPEARLFLLKA